MEDIIDEAKRRRGENIQEIMLENYLFWWRCLGSCKDCTAAFGERE